MSTPTVVITFMNGPADGGWSTLHSEAVTIGSGGDNDVVIGFDPRVAEHHLRIAREEGQWRVKDLSGGLGIIQGDHPVDGDRPLEQGVLLRIGDSELQVSVHDS